MNEETRILVGYRLEKSATALNDAVFLADSSRFNIAVNRLYYSCYYSVSALMLCFGETPKSHKGMKVLFYRHFISNSKFPKELADLYAKLFDARQESDYIDYIEYTSEAVYPWISQTKEFINSITTYVKEHYLKTGI